MQTNNNNQKGFVEQYMDLVLEYYIIPKAQPERLIHPVLNFYMEEIINKFMNKNNEIKLVNMEFPLKKDNNYQTDNIDFLLYDNETVYFVELKSVPDYDSVQMDRYKELKSRIEKDTASFLCDNLTGIRKKSKQKDEYKSLEEKAKGFKKFAGNINKCKIIYIGPEKLYNKIKDNIDGFISFNMLSQMSMNSSTLNDEMKKSWNIIKSKLGEIENIN